MLEFNPLQLEDLPKLRDYFGYSGSRICDTTPGTVMMWRDMYKTEWAIYDGSLYFKVEYPGLGSTFTLPLGGGRREHYRQIADYCCRRGMPIAFYPVPKDELDRLQEFFPNSAAIANRDSFDYLYRAEDLKFFRGKKLSGQRNHVNKFLKTYGNWSFRVITEEDIPAVKAFLDRYAAGRDKAAASFHEDLRKTHEVLDNYQLYDMVGGMLLVDGNIVGFSLGEIAALSFAGVFTPEEGFDFVCKRGRAMQKAGEANPGAMAAVLKLSNEQVEELCAGFEKVWPVNYNCPGQLVCAGEKSQIEAFCQKVEEAGGRAKMLAVSGGFHSPFMESARQVLAQELAGMELAPSKVPVYANYNAQPYTQASAKELLVNQVKSPVRWQETVERLYALGVDTFIECGPGKTLCGLIRKTVKGATVLNVQDAETLRAAVEAVKARG